ncbi:MAG: endonuclease/exonuclease/phosphatase family protein [Bacteroidales bacterium]|nr:endonuclease/exonuclease/phosphatase family protein [Bacteroidales bacterium]
MPHISHRLRPWWRRYGKAVLLAATACTILGLWITAAVPWLHPQQWPRLSTLGLTFPLWLGVTFAWLFFWLMASWRWAALPLAGIVLCWGSVRLYCPLNLPTTHQPDTAITLMSFNTRAFGEGQRDSVTHENFVAQYIAWQQPDIVAVQEALPMSDTYWQAQNRHVLAALPHWASYAEPAVGIFSRFPIVKQQRLVKDFGNGSAAFWLCIAPQDTIIVIVSHLKSFALSQQQQAVEQAVTDHDRARSLLPQLFRKLVRPAKIRAKQADTIAHFIAQQTLPIISCGDFNDTPISYTYRRMRGALHDAFVAIGYGPGYTYRRRAIQVRIDHIHHSAHFRAHNAHIDQSCELSDHHPIFVSLTRQP